MLGSFPVGCGMNTRIGGVPVAPRLNFRWPGRGIVAAMPTPDFVTSLRAHIGHDLLWLSTAAGVVLDDDGRVLLGRRADTGTWALPGGIIEPGEEPADAAVREIFEETGVIAVPEVLAAVTVSEQITYQNGDVVRYLEILFRCRATGGTARVNDAESVEVSWHAPASLPDLHAGTLRRITRAVTGTGLPAYAFSGLEKVLGLVWLSRRRPGQRDRSGHRTSQVKTVLVYGHVTPWWPRAGYRKVSDSSPGTGA
jgi:8-oxo-dGTP pyrophosphatase MutT (NUDIX family)